MGTHIGKTASDRYYPGILENEYLTTQATKILLSGWPDDANNDPVVDLRLVKVKVKVGALTGLADETVLTSRRFDLSEYGGKNDVRDFMKLLHRYEKFDGSYVDMVKFIRDHAHNIQEDGIKTDARDARLLFRRVLASFVVGNPDTNLENFSLMRQEDGGYRLTPNYDLVHMVMYNMTELALKIDKRVVKIGELKPEHILALAKECRITGEELREDLAHFAMRIPQVQDMLRQQGETGMGLAGKFSAYITQRWEKTFATVPVLPDMNRAGSLTVPLTAAPPPARRLTAEKPAP